MFRVCIAILVFTGFCLAQGTGTIYGTVTDPSGAAVPGVKVDATLLARNSTRTATTDNNGQYTFQLLPIGSYLVNAERPGFKSSRREGVTLDADQNVRVDVQLTLGNVSESVSVTAGAPLVESRESQMSTLIDQRRLEELPINGRNIIALAALLPGASQVSAPQTFTGDRSGPTVSFSGSRANANLFLFDGQDFNAVFRNTGLNYPPPDALYEVKVLTNNFNAEYGRNAGGVFNVITKSGTNQIHGALWEFARNDAFNARNFFSLNKTHLVQNQFGATAGGPILKNKLFLFGSYEGLRIRPAALSSSAFPLTAAERAGDFSGGKPITDPSTSKAFPGNQIPSNRFDPVSQAILSKGLMPLPNAPGGALVQTYPSPQDNDQFLLRSDYNLGPRHMLEARYNYNNANQIDATAGQVPTYLPLSRTALVQSAVAGDTWTISPSLINQARVGYNRVASSIANLDPVSLKDLGGNFPEVNGVKIPPSIGISGRVTLGSNSSVNAVIRNEDRQFNDNLTWNHGRHSVKMGFEYLYLRYLNRSYFLSMGDFQFTGSVTGNPAADFLLGRPQIATVASPVLEQGGTQHSFYQYVQDDWRITDRLTLNLGLRYELPLNWTQPENFWSTFRAGQQSTVVPTAPAGILFTGDKGIPRGFVQPDRNNFAPRLGFAWDVFGNGKTAIRGGFGIFYEAIPATIIQNSGQPFRYTYTINGPFSLSDPLRGQAPIPQTVNLTNPLFVGTQQVNYPDPSLRTPYVEQASLSIQREIFQDTVVQVAYVGKFGHKLLMAVSANPALPVAGIPLNSSTVDRRRIYPGFGDNQDLTSSANSNYHALQVEGTKRYARHFTLQGAYTFAKAIDQTSSTSPETPSAPQPLNLALERGPAAFSAKHVGSFSAIADLPTLHTRPAALRLIAGGWQINALYTARTGLPLNIVTGQDNAFSGTPSQRPNVVGDWRQPGGRSRADQINAWFNPNAFALPAAGTFGNAGRDVIVGPPSISTNAGLFKNFALPFREGLRLQFRSEFFNVFNQVNLGNPNLQVSGGKAGRITSAGEPRILQFALKLVY